MKKKYIVFTVIGLVVLGIILKFALKSETVHTAKVKKGDFVQAIYAVGTVKAQESFNLKNGIATRLKERYVNAGDSVKKGQQLVAFDDLSTYRAPFDGMVTQILFDKGELVPAQAIVMTLINPKSYQIEITLDEKSIYAVRKGQKALFSFEANRAQKFAGVVKSIYSSNSTFYVDVAADLKDESILEGMSCDVVIEADRETDQVLVPLGAIDNVNKVKRVNGKNKETLSVQILKQNSEYAIVKVLTEGAELREGDELVVTTKALTNSVGGAPHP